jgi:hypothetical protein
MSIQQAAKEILKEVDRVAPHPVGAPHGIRNTIYSADEKHMMLRGFVIGLANQEDVPSERQQDAAKLRNHY